MKKGLVYTNYIPVSDKPILVGKDFKPSKKLLSRYAQTVVNSNYYGVFKVKDETFIYSTEQLKSRCDYYYLKHDLKMVEFFMFMLLRNMTKDMIKNHCS